MRIFAFFAIIAASYGSKLVSKKTLDECTLPERVCTESIFNFKDNCMTLVMRNGYVVITIQLTLFLYSNHAYILAAADVYLIDVRRYLATGLRAGKSLAGFPLRASSFPRPQSQLQQPRCPCPQSQLQQPRCPCPQRL